MILCPLGASLHRLQLAVSQVVKEYRQAALNAMKAGFDGVEIHAANGVSMLGFNTITKAFEKLLSKQM